VPVPKIRSTVYEVPFTVPLVPSPINVDLEIAHIFEAPKVKGPVPPLLLKPVEKASPYVALIV
jgi:hypothetical protein